MNPHHQIPSRNLDSKSKQWSRDGLTRSLALNRSSLLPFFHSASLSAPEWIISPRSPQQSTCTLCLQKYKVFMSLSHLKLLSCFLFGFSYLELYLFTCVWGENQEYVRGQRCFGLLFYTTLESYFRQQTLWGCVFIISFIQLNMKFSFKQTLVSFKIKFMVIFS